MDVDTGKVLHSSHAHALLYPASLTKMLTGLIAVNWLPPDATVPVSARAAGVTPDKVGMRPGQAWPLPITLHALLISSANDAAYALAQRVGGSLESFAVIMAQSAAEMGMSDTPVLHDPAGLDGSEGVDGGNRMSAWDLAIAARDLLANPTLAAIVRLPTYRFTGPDHIVYELYSHNHAFLVSYRGAVGVKTGFTDRAGVSVAEAATRRGRTMLAVVMHGAYPDQTAEDLLDMGFATPAAREPANAPLLPPVRQPAPAPAPRPGAWGARWARSIPLGRVGRDGPVAEALTRPSGRSGGRLPPAGIAAAGVVIGGGLGYVLPRLRSRRRRRAGRDGPPAGVSPPR